MSDEPQEDRIDFEAWEPQSPPPQFAERVIARIRAEERATAPKPNAARRLGFVTAGAATIAIAAAVLLRASGTTPPSGEAIARDRVEVSIGMRARAVLEPGAFVRWNGDDVTQARGDVFYRVEPGSRFRVHTPAGDVEVKGTCFVVKVRTTEDTKTEDTKTEDTKTEDTKTEDTKTEDTKTGDAMQKRDVKVGAVGAAISALVLVGVYEGKVAASHSSGRVDLAAGESAQLSTGGIVKSSLADGQKAFEASVTSALTDDPLSAANGNLVEQVSEYKKRLEAIAGQKADLEKRLDATQKQLEASQSGGPPPITKHEFDLGAEDWKELARTATVKARIPCTRKADWQAQPELLQKLGLAPQDGPTLKNVYTRSNDRLWSVIKPICAKELGSVEAAEKIGVQTCQHLIVDMENTKDSDASREAMRFVAEVRAGLRPMPGPDDSIHPVARMFLAVSGEIGAFEQDLAQSFGPDEAHRLAYADDMCMGHSTWGGSRPKTPPPK